MDMNLRREIMLKHNEISFHRGLCYDDKYISSNMSIESCIDNIKIQALIEDNFFKDIRFDGEACAVCIGSSSIMCDFLINRSVEEVLKIILEFYKMLESGIVGDLLSGDILVFNETYRLENRKLCAKLPWMGLEKIINKLNND